MLKRYTYEIVVIVDSDDPVPSADVRQTVVALLEGSDVTTEVGGAIIDEVAIS